jgi:hypothetical protein
VIEQDLQHDDGLATTGGAVPVPDVDPDDALVTCADWCPPDEPDPDMEGDAR